MSKKLPPKPITSPSRLLGGGHVAHHHLHDGSTRPVVLPPLGQQKEDSRDSILRIDPRLSAGFFGSAASQPFVDNRAFCTPIENQGRAGSCSAHAVAGAIEHNDLSLEVDDKEERKSLRLQSFAQGLIQAAQSFRMGTDEQGKPTLSLSMPLDMSPKAPAPRRVSRQFQYFVSRQIEGTQGEDNGVRSMRDAVKAPSIYGFLDEASLPYSDDPAAILKSPTKAQYAAARARKVTSYHGVKDGDIGTLKALLATNKVIVCGFQVYDYMLSHKMALKGILKRPTATETLQGGHAILLVGYDDAKQLFLARNSWGKDWGQEGYFQMPYDYVGDPKLTSGFWVIESDPLA